MRFHSSQLQALDLEPDESLLAAEQWLTDRQQCPVASRLLGQASTDPSHEDVKGLEKAITKARRKNSALKSLLDAVHRIIEAGNESNVWDICPPGIAVEVKPRRSPFTDSCRWILPALREVDQALCGAAMVELGQRSKAMASRDPNARRAHGLHRPIQSHLLGLLLVSVTLRSGVTNPASLRALLDDLASPGEWVAGRCSWRELNLKYQSQPDAERRRVHLDVLSELLLSHAQSKPDPDLADLKKDGWEAVALWAKMRSALVALRVKPKSARSFTGWLNAVQLYWSINSSPVIAAMGRGRHISHALKPQAWARIQRISHEVTQEEPLSDNGDDDDGVDSGERRQSDASFKKEQLFPDELRVRWVESAQAALRHKDVAPAMQALEAVAVKADSPHSAQALIPRWGKMLLKSGGYSGQALEISSVYKYISSAGRRIAMFVGSDDLLELGPEGLARVYEEVLDDAVSLGNRKYLAKALATFHRFLVAEYGVAELDTREVLGIGAMRSPVDANVITLDEFYAIRKKIETDPELLAYGSDYVEIAWLMFTLGFRCGFRRMEALCVRLSDVHWSERPEILIRPWANRTLKSKSSTRKSPLAALLDEAELARLERWFRTRLERAESKQEMLFVVPTSDKAAISQSFLMPRIHAAMRAVTGDRTLRFHLLRHAFCSWTLLRMLMGTRPFEPERYFSKHPQTCEWLRQDSPKIKERVLGTGAATRKLVYAVMNMLGHSCVRITLEHYFHFSDIVIAERGRDFIASPTPGALQVASGIPESSLYRLLSSEHGDVEGLRERMRKSGHLVRCDDARSAGQIEGASPEGEVPQLADTLSRWRAMLIQASRNREDDLPKVARIHGLSESDAAIITERARELSSLQSPKSGQFRHPVMEEGGRRLLVPRAPRRRADRQVFDRLARGFEPLVTEFEVRRFEGFSVAHLLYMWSRMSWASRAYLTFPARGIRFASAYWQFLVAVGLTRDEIEVLSHAPVTQRRQRAINKQLGRPQRSEIKQRHPNNPLSAASVDSISIRPVFADGDESDSVRSWRLLMYMAACVLGWSEIHGMEVSD